MLRRNPLAFLRAVARPLVGVAAALARWPPVPARQRPEAPVWYDPAHRRGGSESARHLGVDAAARERQEAKADVAVVGAQPAGIVTALELAGSGLEVLLIESGRRRFRPRAQDLGDAAWHDPKGHAPTRDCSRRQTGAASAIRGRRCLPYHPIDFEPRDQYGGFERPPAKRILGQAKGSIASTVGECQEGSMRQRSHRGADREDPED